LFSKHHCSRAKGSRGVAGELPGITWVFANPATSSVAPPAALDMSSSVFSDPIESGRRGDEFFFDSGHVFYFLSDPEKWIQFNLE
jgi:hypothetical protein